MSLLNRAKLPVRALLTTVSVVLFEMPPPVPALFPLRVQLLLVAVLPMPPVEMPPPESALLTVLLLITVLVTLSVVENAVLELMIPPPFCPELPVITQRSHSLSH